METSIAHLTFGILGAVFLTGVAIILRNFIKIKRSTHNRKQRLKDNPIDRMSAAPQLQKSLIMLN